jgi:hypothetical protein
MVIIDFRVDISGIHGDQSDRIPSSQTDSTKHETNFKTLKQMIKER